MAMRVRVIRRGRSLVAAAVGVVMVGACAPSEPIAPSPEPTKASATPSASNTPSTTPTSDPTPTTTPSPSPSSTLSEEQTAATDTVLEFFRLKNEFGKNPESDVQLLANITTGQTSEIQISTITQYRENGYIQTGDTVYYVLEVGDVFDRETDKTVMLEACTDATTVDLVRPDTGESVLEDGRTYFVDWNIQVLYEGEMWKVGDITSQSVERCGP